MLPPQTERRVSGGAGNRRLLTAEEKIQLELKVMKEREDELRYVLPSRIPNRYCLLLGFTYLWLTWVFIGLASLRKCDTLPDGAVAFSAIHYL